MLADPSILDEKVIAAVLSALFGGAGLKIIEKLLGKRAQEFTEAAAIREELRKQISDLRIEIESLKTESEEAKLEADSWRQKYWTQMEITIEYEREITLLRNELNDIKGKVQSLSTGSL